MLSHFGGLPLLQSMVDCEDSFVVEYSESQRIDHVDSLANSLATNRQNFKDGSSGDWVILEVCPSFEAALECAAQLRDRFPQHFTPPPHFDGPHDTNRRPASDRQKAYLRKLGYHGPAPKDMAQASSLIKQRLANRGLG